MAETYRAVLQSGGLAGGKETVVEYANGEPRATIVEVFDIDGEVQERVWALVVPVTDEPIAYQLLGDEEREESIPN